MTATLEYSLMRKLGINYSTARRVVVEARRDLRMESDETWNAALQRECWHRLGHADDDDADDDTCNQQQVQHAQHTRQTTAIVLPKNPVDSVEQKHAVVSEIHQQEQEPRRSVVVADMVHAYEDTSRLETWQPVYKPTKSLFVTTTQTVMCTADNDECTTFDESSSSSSDDDESSQEQRPVSLPSNNELGNGDHSSCCSSTSSHSSEPNSHDHERVHHTNSYPLAKVGDEYDAFLGAVAQQGGPCRAARAAGSKENVTTRDTKKATTNKTTTRKEKLDPTEEPTETTEGSKEQVVVVVREIPREIFLDPLFYEKEERKQRKRERRERREVRRERRAERKERRERKAQVKLAKKERARLEKKPAERHVRTLFEI